ncbi:hypothetical protein EZS27_008637 [termite gut metagenome]|uniref:RloB domain-containing protein n=1 Tax=termite gut metagenome TaxID=433724 RepID=A0A5J4SEM6_9ZZZZ
MRENKHILSKGKQFAFVVDGECECWYIQMLKRNEQSVNIDLKPEIPQKKGIAEQYNKVVELAYDYDKVFWIVDFDVIIRETRAAKKGATALLQEFKVYYNELKLCINVEVIINNPCLEYWYLLHFKTTNRYFESCDKLVKQLKKHLTEYEKTRKFYTQKNHDIYLQLKPYLNQAISNAEKLGEFNFDNAQLSGISEMQKFFNEEEVKKRLVCGSKSGQQSRFPY